MQENILVSSKAFRNRERIPVQYTCDGENISPELTWEGTPAGTKTIALIMDDPDAPGGTFVHWIVFNIPPDIKQLPEATEPMGNQGKTSFGRLGYGGPCPPPGKPHRYFFKIYALDSNIDIPVGSTKENIEKAMDRHILAKGELIGIYSRS